MGFFPFSAVIAARQLASNQTLGAPMAPPELECHKRRVDELSRPDQFLSTSQNDDDELREWRRREEVSSPSMGIGIDLATGSPNMVFGGGSGGIGIDTSGGIGVQF